MLRASRFVLNINYHVIIPLIISLIFSLIISLMFILIALLFPLDFVQFLHLLHFEELVNAAEVFTYASSSKFIDAAH